MLYLVVLLSLLLPVAAHAENWSTTPVYEPTASDTAQLPLSVTFDWLPSEDGWTVPNGATWWAIWPRNANGAWYRPSAYTQVSAYKYPVYGRPYSCTTAGTSGFRCLDKLAGAYRNINCPATVTVSPLVKWRSVNNPYWNEMGLFWGWQGRFAVAWNKVLPVTGATVTGNGQQINCLYGRTTAEGPGLTWDSWVFRY